VADKFIGTGADGKLADRAQLLADAKATKYASMEYEDVKVTVFGDAAIATGGSKSKGTDASGKPMDEHVRSTGHLGQDAERKMVMCGEPRVADKDVKERHNVESRWPHVVAAMFFVPES